MVFQLPRPSLSCWCLIVSQQLQFRRARLFRSQAHHLPPGWLLPWLNSLGNPKKTGHISCKSRLQPEIGGGSPPSPFGSERKPGARKSDRTAEEHVWFHQSLYFIILCPVSGERERKTQVRKISANRAGRTIRQATRFLLLSHGLRNRNASDAAVRS